MKMRLSELKIKAPFLKFNYMKNHSHILSSIQKIFSYLIALNLFQLFIPILSKFNLN
jgi:hypothetical protein